jgi:hypothetical protein
MTDELEQPLSKGFLVFDNRVVPVAIKSLHREVIEKEWWEREQHTWKEFRPGPITYEVEQIGEVIYHDNDSTTRRP